LIYALKSRIIKLEITLQIHFFERVLYDDDFEGPEQSERLEGGMFNKNHILSACILFVALFTNTGAVTLQNETKPIQPHSVVVGAGLLGIECSALLINFLPGQNHLKFQTHPSNYFKEYEPYLEDKIWHIVGAASMVEMNYQILHYYFNYRYSKPLAGVLSMLFWTGIECSDALNGSGFSLRDELGDCAGVAFSLLRLYFPSIPLKVRIGVKEWGSIENIVTKGNMHSKYDNFYNNYYSIMKTEFVYTTHSIYFGAALSKQRHGMSNIYGLTFGYDYVGKFNGMHRGWWNRPVNFFNRYFTATAGITIWSANQKLVVTN
jgi:hypothetical protein